MNEYTSKVRNVVSLNPPQGSIVKEKYEKLVEKSYKKLKRMMIFYRLREDKSLKRLPDRQLLQEYISNTKENLVEESARDLAGL